MIMYDHVQDDDDDVDDDDDDCYYFFFISYYHSIYHLVMTNSSPWKIPSINPPDPKKKKNGLAQKGP